VKVDIVWLSETECEVTLTPGWFGRLFGSRIRRGFAFKAECEPDVDERDEIGWFWKTTQRYVGWQVMRAIEAAPVQALPSARLL